MKVEFGDMKPLQTGVDVKPPTAGSFSGVTPVQWYKCREQFANIWDEKTPAFFFSHPNGISEQVAAFISKTEDVLNLTMPFGVRTEFCRTNRPFALWVSPAPFWRECRMRRSLFTILLRCGFEYRDQEDNYESALYSVDYITETKMAVNRFLFGYTKFLSNANMINYPSTAGWRDFFRTQDQTAIIQYLGLPPQTKVERTILGLGTIWN